MALKYVCDTHANRSKGTPLSDVETVDDLQGGWEWAKNTLKPDAICGLLGWGAVNRPDLTCDEAKAHKGIAVKHSHKLLL